MVAAHRRLAVVCAAVCAISLRAASLTWLTATSELQPRCRGSYGRAARCLASVRFSRGVLLIRPSRQSKRRARCTWDVAIARAASRSSELPDENGRSSPAWKMLSTLLGAGLACTVGLTSALAQPPAAGSAAAANVECVDAAWAIIKRSFYDQSFNNQDWEASLDRYVKRAKRGEPADRLVREMVASLGDEYSRVIDAAAFQGMAAYDALGVGVVLNRRDGNEVVISNPPFPRSAAEKVGLRAGDVVVALDGRSLESEPLLAAMDRVAMADPAQVTLEVRRKAAGDSDAPPLEFQVTLDRVRTAVAAATASLDYGVVNAAPGRGDHRVGYLRLKRFGSRSPLEISAALKELQQVGADELVVDLRGNTGGSFQAALEVAAIFLEPGLVASHVQTKSAVDQPFQVLRDETIPARQPMIVLVDGFSASASEVLAAALRGNCRATLQGSRTFGKAKIQSVFGLPTGEAAERLTSCAMPVTWSIPD